MKTKPNHSFTSRILLPACAIALVCVLGSAGHVAAQSTAQATTPAAISPVKQRMFATSQQAAAALIQGAEQFDVPLLMEILGPGGADLVVTEDPVQDKQRAAWFAAKAQEKNAVTRDPKNPNRAILSVGNEDWPYPVPIVKKSGGWYFDAAEASTASTPTTTEAPAAPAATAPEASATHAGSASRATGPGCAAPKAAAATSKGASVSWTGTSRNVSAANAVPAQAAAATTQAAAVAPTKPARTIAHARAVSRPACTITQTAAAIPEIAGSVAHPRSISATRAVAQITAAVPA